MSKLIKIENEYIEWIKSIKEDIRGAQLKAALSVNREMLILYFNLGKRISEAKADMRWGGKFYSNLSAYLRDEFLEIKGFSETNLRYMVKFYSFYNQVDTILPQAVEELHGSIYNIPWGHQRFLLDNCKSIQEALFYTNKIVENGWSRNVLMNIFETNLFGAEGKAITNFKSQLPSPHSDLAQQTLKDPYNFDFLALRGKYNERELEDALTTNITKFLLELGSGFSYVGRQQRITVGEKEFFIDLLFYHLKLRSYVVVELKTGEFQAEYVSKLGLYVSAINHQVKHEDDKPTIGLLICKSKDEVVAKYTLESSSQPIGISEYQLSELYPKEIENALPSIEEIERELESEK